MSWITVKLGPSGAAPTGRADRNWEKAADYHDSMRERRLDRGRLAPLG
ncbi:hypothetical protein [Streptomyces sp. NPDC086989]